jgi:hypothetical protein
LRPTGTRQGGSEAPDLEVDLMAMADIAFIAATLTFFGLCVAYVRGLDRIVRAAEEAEEEGQEVPTA